MRRHGLCTEEGTLTEAGWVLKTWCVCDHRFTARARSVRRAQRVIRRRYRDHKGFAVAAGPGQGMAA